MFAVPPNATLLQSFALALPLFQSFACSATRASKLLFLLRETRRQTETNSGDVSRDLLRLIGAVGVRFLSLPCCHVFGLDHWDSILV